jgi:FecR protein
MKKLMMMVLISLILFPSVYAGASELGGMRFSFIRGDVQVRTEDTQDWVPASINMPLKEGDRIWVPEEGAAEIQTKGGTYLRLADRSALDILTLDEDSYQTYLSEGRLYANLRGGRDSLLQVDTSSSSVRAHEKSKFGVDVPERDPVNVSVFQGEVNVENSEGSIRVASGEVLSLGEGAYSEKSTLGSPDDWERWNYERDNRLAERRPPSRHLPEELQPYSNDFYDNGRWVQTPDYGYVWTPTVSVSVGWAPYRHGRWVWIGGDYVWVSYEPWGWAPYHYGRWYFAASIGWCWVPPARGAVYWGPGYVGWVYTNRHVAWVPLAPRETYYGRGHHGPHSVNVTNVNVTNVHVEKTVYRNVRVNNAVTTVNHETFVRGKPADARVRENPFLTEKIHAGRPPIKPERGSSMPVVREVPQTKRPPEPVREVNVKQLKEQRPMVKSREASVFTPETRPREMPVKEGEAKPTKARTERAKELRQSPRSVEKSMAPAPAERRAGQPGPSETRVETPKEPEKSGKILERSRSPEQTLKKAEEQKQPAPAATPSVGPQQREQERPSNRGTSQPAPSAPAVRAPKEVKSPERGTDRRMESRSPERPAERVQPKSKEVTRSEQEMQQQAPEPKTLEKRTERSRGSKNKEQGG